MEKSRTLPVNYGAGNGWYYPTTCTLSSYSPDWYKEYWNDLGARFAEGLLLVNKQAVPGPYVGSQWFSSSTRKRPLFNNCQNRRHEGFSHPVTYKVRAYNQDNYWYCAWLYQMNYFVGYSLADANPVPPDWRNVDEVQRRAWWSMQPRFEGEFQALNFLYELKDFKDVLRHLSKIDFKAVRAQLGGVKHIITRAKRILSREPKNLTALSTVGNATKVFAEAILFKNLAVDPTVRDLMNLHAQLLTLLQEVQNDFFERGKDTQSTHYSETLDQTTTWTVGIRNYYWRAIGRVAQQRFTATMQYRYEYQMRSWFEALKRYYGLNFNASVVWNALPFTFVIDYFLKVGQAIDFMSTDPNVELRLMQYCESVLSTQSAGMHINSDEKASVLVNGGETYHGQLISGFRGTWYHRRVTYPNKGSALPRLKLPSGKQAGNMAALLRCMW
jgi:hypothetical protein